MKRIAHISDLHFGTEDPGVAAGLLDDLTTYSPHLVCVSGDLTQRARRSQFLAARRYLDRIAAPTLIVPGNHDVPLYNILSRFARPFTGYCQTISSDLSPFFQDDEIAVAGVNTARSNTWKEGRISLAQMELLRCQFEGAAPQSFKILVCHHPFIPPDHDMQASLVGRAREALKMLETCGCGLILSGHLHQAYSGDVRTHHLEVTRSIVVAQAGTAISQRRRDEPNAYNQLVIDGDTLVLLVRAWDGRRFATVGESRYHHTDGGWIVES